MSRIRRLNGSFSRFANGPPVEGLITVQTPRVLARVLDRIESAESLDGVSEKAAGLLAKVIPAGPVQDVASGVPAGHPAHPALVAVPIGSWLTASVLDLTGADADAARRAVAIGIVGAAPAAVTGASDWLFTAGAERRVGAVHAAANYTGLALQVASWSARRRGRRGRGAALTLAANAITGVGGWLGGHLAYAQGVGVDTTAFQKLPTEWTDVAAETDVPADGATGVEADGVPVLLARVDGRVVALADRCTHRGAGLHEGEIADGCVTCPWHGGVFDLRDGSVRSGPPTRPQPVLDVQVSDGRISVRRHEVRTMRTNPVGR